MYNLAKNDIFESYVGCWVEERGVSKLYSELLILTKTYGWAFPCVGHGQKEEGKRRRRMGKRREEEGAQQEKKWKNQPHMKKRQIIDLYLTTDAKKDLYDYLGILS